jgi:hypothetical protein
MSRKRVEIGSEFWLEQTVPQPVADRDGVYTISGRTAIDVILQDMLRIRTVKSVEMPAWCCDSMITPFTHRNINVHFYDYGHTDDVKDIGCRLKVKDTADDNVDILYITNYFGYENSIDVEIVKQFKAKGAIILYDRTHSFLMNDDPYLDLADYSFASIRKWMGVIGGAVVEGVKDVELRPCPYLEPKETAMRTKQTFMAGDDTVDKQEFLKLYGEFGHHLAEDYCDYAMDDLSYAIYKATDFEEMKTQRRANAQYLHEHLNLQFLSPLTPNACPLFVPVLFHNKEERDRVRKRLIEAEIYCPIHWPKPAQITASFEANKIYDTELSLICDQRYTADNMARMVSVINN